MVVGRYLSNSERSLSPRFLRRSAGMLVGSFSSRFWIHDSTKFFHCSASEMYSTPARVTVAGEA